MTIEPGMTIVHLSSGVEWEVLPESGWDTHVKNVKAICIRSGNICWPSGAVSEYLVGEEVWFTKRVGDNPEFYVDDFESWVRKVRRDAGVDHEA